MKVKILSIEPAVSKAKQVYYKVKTNKGLCTAFDEDIVKAIKDTAIGEEISLDIKKVEKDGITYLNIRGFGMDDEEVMTDDEHDMKAHDDYNKLHVKPQDFGKEIKEAIKEERGTSFYTSYAKDIFIALINHPKLIVGLDETNRAMDNAIDLVKQARDAFS